MHLKMLPNSLYFIVRNPLSEEQHSLKIIYSMIKHSQKTHLLHAMRLCQPPDGSTSPKYKLLHF
jgi:hypothetical protein